MINDTITTTIIIEYNYIYIYILQLMFNYSYTIYKYRTLQLYYNIMKKTVNGSNLVYHHHN